MPKHRKPKGLSTHRFRDNPEEKAFHEAWVKHNAEGRTLAWLLNVENAQRPIEPTDREHAVAATVVQWLGSPVGQSFLADLGYAKQATTAPTHPSSRCSSGFRGCPLCR